MGAEYVPVGPDASIDIVGETASEPSTVIESIADRPFAIRVIKTACEIGSFIVATIVLAILALIVLVIVLALVIVIVGLLAVLWYLIYWGAVPHCSEPVASSSSPPYWRAPSDHSDCVAEMVMGNIAAGIICVIWGSVAVLGLCSLRKKTTRTRHDTDIDCTCDALRVNTMGCLWVGILAVWALQYVMIFVVREVGLSAMVPLLHIAVIAIVYPIDYHIGALIHPHNTDTENV